MSLGAALNAGFAPFLALAVSVEALAGFRASELVEVVVPAEVRVGTDS
jgi:hypothetical protein